MSCDTIYFQISRCRHYKKTPEIPSSKPCIVAMETKNNIFDIKMQTSKFHLSNGIGIAIQENGQKRY